VRFSLKILSKLFACKSVGSADPGFVVFFINNLVLTNGDKKHRVCDVIVWLHSGEWSLRVIASLWIGTDFGDRIRCEAGFAERKVLKEILKRKLASDVPVF
jgi:hypothetical protein